MNHNDKVVCGMGAYGVYKSTGSTLSIFILKMVPI